jgi:NADH-dependent peroxiredoxin subunit C
MIQINQNIPDFQLDAYHNDKQIKLKLSDYKGQWLILFFYPGDFTFVCPTELKELAENYPTIKKLGAEILSVSTDSVFVHKAWHDESKAVSNIKFPMLADPTGKLSQAFGVYIEDKGQALRGTFLIDPDQKVKALEIHNNDIGRNVTELIRKLQAAKFVRENGGEVCPANWHPGEKTLKPGLNLVGKI